MGLAVTSDRCWPLVVTVFDERMSSAWADSFMADYDACFARKEPFVCLLDASRVKDVPDAAMRRRIADWNKTQEQASLLYSLGVAVVITSSVVRGALTAVHWITPPVRPTKVVATPYDGVTFLVGVLQSAEIDVRRAILEYQESLRPLR